MQSYVNLPYNVIYLKEGLRCRLHGAYANNGMNKVVVVITRPIAQGKQIDGDAALV